MQVSLKFLLQLLAVAVTFFPYFVLSDSGSPRRLLISNISLIAIQLTSIGFVIACYLKASSKSFKLFWQYLGLASVCAFARYLSMAQTGEITLALYQDFLSLFSYFFLILAIETKPHLSDIPLNKYSSGRVPSIFFTLLAFGYFVLLPAESVMPHVQQQLMSKLFSIAISTLILLRLITCLIKCGDLFWRYTYAVLSLAVASLLCNHLIGFYSLQGNTIVASDYLGAILPLLPYCLLIIAANITLSSSQPVLPTAGDSHSDTYILLLMLAATLTHLLGLELQLSYIINSRLQTAVIALWLIIGSLLVVVINNKRRHQRQELQQLIEEGAENNQQLCTENNRLMSNLVNSEDKAIVSASNNAILTTSLSGEILSANPAAVQMFQILEQDIKGANVSSLFSNVDEMHFFFDFQSNVYSLQRKESGISRECIALRSDNQQFPVQAELQWAERQEQPLIVITFINLTARKLAEKQTLELKDKFVANISHEFRTPLTIINGIIDRYLAKTSESKEQQDLTTAKRNGLRLVRMVEQLLELSRLSDNPKLSLSNYRLHALMAMPIDSFRRLASQNQLGFSSSIPEDLWLECDAQAFEKIIFNLLANAIKYTPAGGEIKVSAYREDDSMILDVIDSGIGINKNSQQKIFDRFVRAEDSMNQATFGVGIGLSLVSELVKSHGWRINLISEQGKGSKFSLSIPLAAAQETEHQTPISLSENEVSSLLTEQRQVSAAQNNHNHQVVLVIEDNLDMQSHIKQVVEQQHNCLLAGSGELGLELAQEYIPDLIVCDLMLTGIDGFEVLQQIKQHELTAHIPVILLTARSDLDSRLEGLHLNADEYLSKPFNQHELLVRIQNLIDNRKRLRQNYLQKFDTNLKVERRHASQENAAKLADEDSEAVSLDDKFLARLESVAARLYTEPTLEVTQIATALALSERQLQRKMKVLLATTPKNFIKEFRLKKARELLKNGTQIGRIALDVGFSSQTYFGRCFKEVYQCTPKQYQQQCQSNEQRQELGKE